MLVVITTALVALGFFSSLRGPHIRLTFEPTEPWCRRGETEREGKAQLVPGRFGTRSPNRSAPWWTSSSPHWTPARPSWPTTSCTAVSRSPAVARCCAAWISGYAKRQGCRSSWPTIRWSKWRSARANRGGFASRVLRVVRHQRRTSLTASLGCWHAYPGASPPCSPWHRDPHLGGSSRRMAVPRLTSRTVTAGPGCGARDPPYCRRAVGLSRRSPVGAGMVVLLLLVRSWWCGLAVVRLCLRRI